LQRIVEDWKFSISPPDLQSVEQCYVTLARVTGDPDLWIRDAEKRILAPMFADKTRDVWALSSFSVMLEQMGAPSAFRNLVHWMTGDDAPLAREAIGALIFQGSYDSAWAVLALRVLLKTELDLDICDDKQFPQSGAAATNTLLACVEQYRRRASEAEEIGRPRNSPLPRDSVISANRISQILATFRANGAAEAQKIGPVLLALYEEEPFETLSLDPEIPLRSQIVETLRALGVDLKPEAAKWIPRLAARLETEDEARASIFELGAYGELASPAVPDLIRYARLGGFHRHQALVALHKIAPEDKRVKALLRVERFDPPSFDPPD
jgi:hypothetical protein